MVSVGCGIVSAVGGEVCGEAGWSGRWMEGSGRAAKRVGVAGQRGVMLEEV